MAQRISRAKRTLRGRGFAEPGDLAVVLRVLSLVYHAGHGRRNDLAGEAIRLTRQLLLATTEPEARGLLALLLLQHARLPARTDADGRFVPLDEQDRSRLGHRRDRRGCRDPPRCIAEQRRGRYQILAAIAALTPTPTSEETDWLQILEWYDELVALSGEPDREDPAAVLNRAVAVGHVGRRAGSPRPSGSVRCSAIDSSGTPSAPTCSNWAASSQPPATLTRLRPNARRGGERDHLIRRSARARARRNTLWPRRKISQTRVRDATSPASLHGDTRSNESLHETSGVGRAVTAAGPRLASRRRGGITSPPPTPPADARKITRV